MIRWHAYLKVQNRCHMYIHFNKNLISILSWFQLSFACKISPKKINKFSIISKKWVFTFLCPFHTDLSKLKFISLPQYSVFKSMELKTVYNSNREKNGFKNPSARIWDLFDSMRLCMQWNFDWCHDSCGSLETITVLDSAFSNR